MSEQKELNRINGLIAAAFTPLDENGNILFDSIERYADFLKRNGLKGVFVGGTTGEGVLLSMEERMTLTEIWQQEAEPDFRIITNVSHESFKEAQKLSDHAAKTKVFGVASMGPVFFKPESSEELARYCRAICKNQPELPFYFYHIPVMTGIHCSMVDFCRQMLDVPNFAGIKYTHEDFKELKELYAFNETIEILHGRDESLIEALKIGIKSGIGGTYNYAAGLYTDMISSYQKRDMKLSEKFQESSIKMIDVIISHGGNVTAGKKLMQLIGMDCGPNRFPVNSLNENESEQMKKELKAQGFFEYCNK